MAKFMDVHNGLVGVTEHQLREARGCDLAVEAAEGVHVEHAWLDPARYQTPRWLRPARSQLPGLRARSAPAGTQIVLRDGSYVLIRQVQSADAPLLADGFARLSADSRWMRFLTRTSVLSGRDATHRRDHPGLRPARRDAHRRYGRSQFLARSACSPGSGPT